MTEALRAPKGRGDVVAAMVFFAVVNLLLVAINGVREGGDTPLYLDGANRVLDGRPLIDRQPSYAGYVYVVAAVQAAGAGTFGVVMLQILGGAGAAAGVYAMAAAMAGRLAGGLAAVLYSLDVDTNRWHQFILADSLYVSLFVLAVWLTYRAAIQQGVVPVALAAAALFAAGLVRPEGWFLLPAALCFVVMKRARSNAQKFAGFGALLGAAALLAMVLAPAFSGNVAAVGPADMLQRGQTIWDFDGWRVPMPPGDGEAGGQAGAAAAYALRHPVSTITLMAARVAVHFAHVRPFYSTPHNLVIVAWLIPVYAAALFAIRRLGFTALVSWIVAAIGTQTLVVALTHAEWDGRYLAHVLPLINTLVGAGVAIALGKAHAGRQVQAHA